MSVLVLQVSLKLRVNFKIGRRSPQFCNITDINGLVHKTVVGPGVLEGLSRIVSLVETEFVYVAALAAVFLFD